MNDNNGAGLPTDLSKVSTADLMKLTGQSDSGSEDGGLPRLSINHASEDDEGNSLPRGYYAIKNPATGEIVFAEQTSFRPFIRLFMYSAWDNEAEAFGSQTVQLNTLNGVFYDSIGGERCGRLTKVEMDKLDANSPEYAVQKNVKCNQVIYGIVAATGINSKGEKAAIQNLPVVWYVKGVSFIPVSNFIRSLNKQKKPMWETVLRLTTVKNKKGANTFYGAVVQHEGNAQFTADDKKLMEFFFKGVKGFNDSILKKYRDVIKSNTKAVDKSLGDSLESELATS